MPGSASGLGKRARHQPGTAPQADSTPRLFAALDALPWAQTPIAASVVDRAHGRVTTRTIQVLPAPADLPFPHVNQVWLIERYVTALDGTPSSAVAAPRPPRSPRSA